MRTVVDPSRASTGNAFLDTALDGGLSHGSVILVEGDEGAGVTEFAFAVLNAALARGKRARYLSALRSPERVMREAREVMRNDDGLRGLEVRGADVLHPALHHHLAQTCASALADLGEGDALAIESVSALYRRETVEAMGAFVQKLGDLAAKRGLVVLLLHASGSVPGEVEAIVKESADGHVALGWRDGTSTRRRILTIPKMRGLPSVVEGEQVSIFEFELLRGAGFAVSRVKNVV